MGCAKEGVETTARACVVEAHLGLRRGRGQHGGRRRRRRRGVGGELVAHLEQELLDLVLEEVEADLESTPARPWSVCPNLEVGEVWDTGSASRVAVRGRV